LKEKGADTKKLYVAFVSKELQAENSNDLKISQFKPDEAHLDGNRVLLNITVGAGKTRLDEKIYEKTKRRSSEIGIL
jgi:hypothetical protein